LPQYGLGISRDRHGTYRAFTPSFIYYYYSVRSKIKLVHLNMSPSALPAHYGEGYDVHQQRHLLAENAAWRQP